VIPYAYCPKTAGCPIGGRDGGIRGRCVQPSLIMRQVSHAGRAWSFCRGHGKSGGGPSPSRLGRDQRAGPPCKASEVALAGNPRWPPLTKRLRVAGSEAVSLAQHTHQGKSANFMPRCNCEPPWRQSARATPGHRLSKHFSTVCPQHQSNVVRQPVSRWLTRPWEANQQTWVKGRGRACPPAVRPRREPNGLKRKNRRWSWV